MSRQTNDNSCSPPAIIDRVAITPQEFAAKFGKSVYWAYRRIYAGELRVLEDFRPRLIPVTEVDRFLQKAARFTGNGARAKKKRFKK